MVRLEVLVSTSPTTSEVLSSPDPGSPAQWPLNRGQFAVPLNRYIPLSPTVLEAVIR